MNGIVSNIQKFSIHDGPGIRTTVFLKGCNMRCFWCHNPETISPCQELQVFSNNCIGCGKCIEVCPVNAHQIKGGSKRYFRCLCKHCGKCVDKCFPEALVMNGCVMRVEEVIKEVEKDANFYKNSGGGVTFSGGEPLIQIKYLRELLKACKEKNFHTAVDTSGNVPWEDFKEILPYTDLFLYDIKIIDNVKHMRGTGANNELILENLKKLAKEASEIYIRIPIIPNFNDEISCVEEIASFIRNLETIQVVELLPFHPIGKGKYESLDMDYVAQSLSTPSDELLNMLMDVCKKKGLEVRQG